jgi:hypothetical protein
VGWFKSPNFGTGSSDLIKISVQNPILWVTQQAYKPLPIAKAIRQTPTPSVEALWKQIKRIPADNDKIKELHNMKGTMILGHCLTAFCHTNARVMLNRDAVSTCGR